MNRIKLNGFTDEQLKAVGEICGDIGLVIDGDSDITVSAERGDALEVGGDKKNVIIKYSRECELWRAFSYVPSFIKDGKPVSEKAKYEMLCYMSDNSRNAVYNIPTAKQTIRYLALMGYDSMMLYTEDTYELPDYPYFGHMRGRFTEAELRELDGYAYMFGIELIPCIQTLAHLETALRWPGLNSYRDNGNVLLVGHEKTYQLIDAMLTQLRKCFRTDRIHVGMDEAWGLGAGEYLKKNGYKDPSYIMIEHLEHVTELCRKHGYKPMMWSDMFFQIAFGRPRVSEGNISQDVADKVPEGMTLVYWDYYSMDVGLFSHMLDLHKQFDNPTVFAGGAWKWYGFGAHNAFSLKSTKMQLDECEKRGINSIIVTSWGDNGAEASQFSAFASVLYFAERCYNDGVDNALLNARAEQALGISFDELMAFDLPDALPGATVEDGDKPKNPSKYMLYTDPFERLLDSHIETETAKKTWNEHAERLMELAENDRFGYAFETLGRLCRILSVKCDIGQRLYGAYNSNDREAIAYISETEIPYIVSELEKFICCFRKQWYKENKTFGFITQEIRLGGLKERMISVKLRLDAYLGGDTDRIEELEYPTLPLDANNAGKYIRHNNWSQNVGAGIV